ncbi:hypothetical protein MBOU_21200 [Mycobacterium bourgelatii]|uniref:Transmembrane protein n=2 Tax=Mycobacterium bourgelatii TaxID=1273442 RepID=A0A7I9YN79_MYCBU|nr:hypothetical protein MBOU_21200 [Mycobacterium bourgelatii]
MITLRPDRERPTRRAQSNDGFRILLVLWATVVVLLGVPLAFAVGDGVHESRSRVHAEQEQNRQLVTAVVTSDKVQPQALSDPELVSVPAKWFAGGTEHAGLISAPRGVKAGDSVDIWVDADGYHVGVPHRTPLDEAVAVGLSTWLSVAAVGAVVMAAGWAVAERFRETRQSQLA